MSLRARILSLVIAALLLACLAVAWSARVQLSSATRVRALQALEAVVAQVEHRYASHVDTLASNVELFAGSSTIEQYLRTESEELRFDLLQPGLLSLFASYHRAYPDYFEIRVLLADGYEDARFASRDDDNLSDEEADSAAFRMLEAGGTRVAVHRNPDDGQLAIYGGKAVVLAEPGVAAVNAKPTLRGYILVTADLGFLKRATEQTRIADAGQLVVAERDGSVLYADRSRFGLANLPSTALEAGADESAPGLATALDRVRYLVTCRMPEPSLRVLALLPEAALGAERRRLDAILAGVVVGVLLLVGLLASRLFQTLVVRPIEALEGAVRKVREGNLDASTDIQRSDEIGDLARSFASMTHSLREQRTAIERQSRELRGLAYYDSLTKLPNRGRFREQLESALRDAKRRKTLVVLMFIDLDGFKRVNDTLGHDAGDVLLIEVAARLKDAVRDTDVVSRLVDEATAATTLADEATTPEEEAVARLGGDEFTVLVSDLCQRDEVATLAERILHGLGEPAIISGTEVVTTPSIGIALYPDDGDDSETLLRHADTAMYEAKRGGKNRYSFYSAEMEELVLERVRMEARLRIAIESDSFELHYQPLVNAATGAPEAVEALLRWEDAELGRVNPDSFIALAEDVGLIVPLGRWVIREACASVRRMRQQGLDELRVCVNVAGAQFLEQPFVEELSAALAEHGLPPDALELELTERTIMSEGTRTMAQLDAVRALGVGLAVDDFGTGYSSLAYLKRFPIALLKIDRRFVTHVDCDPSNAALSRAIVAMARAMGMRTVAEGVETRAERDTLRQIGVDLIQGWYYARAMPEGECLAWLQARDHHGVKVPAR